MHKAFQYYARYQGARSSLTTLPPWGKPVVLLFALPGLLLLFVSVALFILLLLVSILALLLLTAPVYRILKAFAPTAAVNRVETPKAEEVFVQSAPRRQVEVKILDDDQTL